MAVKSVKTPSTSVDDLNRIVHANHWGSVLCPRFARVARGDDEVPRDPCVLAGSEERLGRRPVGGEPGVRVPMERIHPDGFFVALFPGRAAAFPYRLAVENHEGFTWEFIDPYRFSPGPFGL